MFFFPQLQHFLLMFMGRKSGTENENDVQNKEKKRKNGKNKKKWTDKKTEIKGHMKNLGIRKRKWKERNKR